MDERFDHLELPFLPETHERERRKGFSQLKTRLDKEHFFSVQIQEFNNIKKKYDKDKKRYRQYLDPNLIFKIEINQSVDEDDFRQKLKSMNIDVLSPSPDKKGFWVVFAEDEDLVSFKEKLRLYVEEHRYSFFHAIGGIAGIPIKEKIGERLKKEGIKPDETAYLDVEIWRMEDARLKQFVEGLRKLIESKRGKITDRLTTRNFCLLRINVDNNALKEILPLREIAYIDRPPRPYIEYRLLSIPREKLKIEGPPPKNATGVLIVDSGILSKHPLLEKAVGDEIAIATRYSDKIKADKPQDDVGHGTKVAGVALYGDIKKCIDDKRFKPEIWILSAKIMYGVKNPVTGEIEPKYDEEELLEHQLEKAVKYFVENYPSCKVINLSLGNSAKRMFTGKRQFNLASLVDELAAELKVIFVISSGNFDEFSAGYSDTYPDYLLKETDKIKIIDPATAALGLTVGSVTQEYGPSNTSPRDLLFSPARTNYPSPFTRVGTGYKGMIKPDIVEEGGNIIRGSIGTNDIGGKLIMLNPNWITDGKLFTVDFGTSFSAPKIAHYLANLCNKYPFYSPNLIKALLISSTSIPAQRPGRLSQINLSSSDQDFIDLLKVYGYGKPDLEKALFSDLSRVLLLKDNRIKLESVHLYFFYLPLEFIAANGFKRLSITLTYDPPVNKNRIDYLGCSMEFHLFKNSEVEDVKKYYEKIKKRLKNEEETVPKALKNKEIKLHPGVNLRKRGVHQKGIVEFRGVPKIDINKPLVLAIICQNRWIKEENHEQEYAVVVGVQHTAQVDLYNKIRLRNQEKVRVMLKGKG